MKKAFFFMVGGALVVLGWLAVGQAQENEPAPDRGASILYLRTPEGRLARLDRLLHLTEAQKEIVLRAFKKADRSARVALAKGDAEVRDSLDQERRAQFDDLKSDVEVAPVPVTMPHAFQRMPSFSEQEAASRKGQQSGGKRKKTRSSQSESGSVLPSAK